MATISATFAPLLKWQNLAATADINKRLSGRGGGILNGAQVGVVAGQLKVTLTDFAVLGRDGFFAEVTSIPQITLQANTNHVLATHIQYLGVSGDVTRLLLLTRTEYDNHIQKAYLLRICQINVPAAATELDLTWVDYNFRDSVDTLARKPVRGIVTSTADLPTDAAPLLLHGDIYFVMTTRAFVQWDTNTSKWLEVGSPHDAEIALNTSGVTINRGLVSIDIYDLTTGLPTIVPLDVTDAESIVHPRWLDANLADGDIGVVYKRGVITSLDTTLVTAIGKPVFASSQVSGALANRLDADCAQAVFAGSVLRRDAVNGTLYFAPRIGNFGHPVTVDLDTGSQAILGHMSIENFSIGGHLCPGFRYDDNAANPYVIFPISVREVRMAVASFGLPALRVDIMFVPSVGSGSNIQWEVFYYEATREENVHDLVANSTSLGIKTVTGLFAEQIYVSSWTADTLTDTPVDVIFLGVRRMASTDTYLEAAHLLKVRAEFLQTPEMVF